MRWFHRREFNSRVYVFDKLLLEASISVFGKSAIDAHAFVHSKANLYWRMVSEHLQEESRTGRWPLFEVVDNNSRRLFWPPARHSQSHPERKVFRRLMARPQFLQGIDSLSHREYEALPCVLFQLIGGKHHLTPSGNEWGVDFFAALPDPSMLTVLDGSRSPIRIVGQCKKYNRRLEVSGVKEFSRTLEALRNCKPEIERHVPAWFRAGSGPIVPWIICHSGFQSGAVSLARDEGMVASDSIDIAECFCHIRRICSLHGVAEKRHYMQHKCQSILG